MQPKSLLSIPALVLLASPLTAVAESSQPPPIDVGICVSSTRFYARNYSPDPQVFLFRCGDSMAWRTVAAGCDIGWDFPTQLLTDVRLEVATWIDGVWHRSGTIALADVASRGLEAVWIQADASSTSWGQIGAVLLPEATGESMFPAELPSPTSVGTSGEDALMAPTHVPVITPSDVPQGDVPPKLEDRPLPPV